MIVREVLENPDLLSHFDYFNDSWDTICSLRNQIATPTARAVATELEMRTDIWWKEHLTKCNNDRTRI